MTNSIFLMGMSGGYEWIIIIFMLGLFAGWVLVLVDIVRSEFINTSTKVMWLLVVLFLSLFGVGLYLLVGRGQKKIG